jgi:regulator of sigma E protease
MEPGPEDPMLGPALAAVTRRGTANAFVLASDLGIEEADADKLLLTLADWNALTPLENDEYSYRSRFDSGDADDPALLDRARQSTYRSLPTWKRIVVLSSGVVLNLVTAVLVFTVMLTAFGYFEETTVVGRISPNSGAASAGIQTGDRIVSIAGEPIAEWEQIVSTIAQHEPGDAVSVVVTRDGSRVTLEATLGEDPETSSPLLGVGPEFVRVRPGPGEALAQSFVYIGMTFQAILRFFNPSTFQSAIGDATSVIGASYLAADAARTDWLSYAWLVAALSLSLGVINVFPIPPLDGGKILLEVIERFRGRPLSRRVSLALSATGAMLLFALIGYLMYAGVVRFIID